MSPRAPARPCSDPTCPTLGCTKHDAKARKRRYYAANPRGTTTQQGYGYRWQQARERFLADNPWCVAKRDWLTREQIEKIRERFHKEYSEDPDKVMEFKDGGSGRGAHGLRCGAPATVVDHIIPHRGDLSSAAFWDETNWQPLCKRHHDRKTAREGRWG